MNCAACPYPSPACPGLATPRLCRLAATRADYRRQVATLAGDPALRPSPQPGSLAVYGYLTSYTGYGQLTGWIARALHDLGVPLHFEEQHTHRLYFDRHPFVEARVAMPQAGPVLQIAIPDTEVRPARPTVILTMWETDRLAPRDVEQLNKALAVVVPCRMNADGFRASGVSVPIRIVPLGVDAAEDDYRDDGTPFPEICTFGMAGRMAHGGIRKNLNEGMAAFRAAFPGGDEPARMVVKVWPDCLPLMDAPGDPRIEVVTTPMQPRQMAAWYRTLTALFVPSRGEGWGLHTHQALACGRPVIAADWGGTAAFFDPACCVPLPYVGERSRGNQFNRGVGDWIMPTHEGMVAGLRRIYDLHRADPAALRRMGTAAAARAAEFPWARTGRELLAVLREFGVVPGPDPHASADCGDGVFVTDREGCDRALAGYPLSIHVRKPEDMATGRICGRTRAGDGPGLVVTYAEGASLATMSPGLDAVAAYLAQPGEVLIHCAAGACRGPTLAVLAKVARGCDPGRAMAAVAAANGGRRGIPSDLHDLPMAEIRAWAATRPPTPTLDVILNAVAACPDRGGVLPLGRQAEGCAGGERSECRAGRGPACRPDAVTLRECMACRAAALTGA